MKKQTPSNPTQVFKFPFTKMMIVLAIAVLLLSVVGIGFSVYRICEFGIDGFTEALKSPLLILVSAFCIVLVVALLVKSQYFVSDTHYGTQFGLIKASFPLKEVTAIELNTDTSKLTVYVGENFSVLTLSPVWRDDFIAAMRKSNPNIDFTFTLDSRE